MPSCALLAQLGINCIESSPKILHRRRLSFETTKTLCDKQSWIKAPVPLWLWWLRTTLCLPETMYVVWGRWSKARKRMTKPQKSYKNQLNGKNQSKILTDQKDAEEYEHEKTEDGMTSSSNRWLTMKTEPPSPTPGLQRRHSAATDLPSHSHHGQHVDQPRPEPSYHALSSAFGRCITGGQSSWYLWQ